MLPGVRAEFDSCPSFSINGVDVSTGVGAAFRRDGAGLEPPGGSRSMGSGIGAREDVACAGVRDAVLGATSAAFGAAGRSTTDCRNASSSKLAAADGRFEAGCGAGEEC